MQESNSSPDRGNEVVGRTITVVSYDEGSYAEEAALDLSPALDQAHQRKVTWILIAGKLSAQEIGTLQSRLDLHPVIIHELEEHLPGRPKLLDFENSLFISWRMLRLREEEVEVERMSNLLTNGLLITISPLGHTFHKTFEAIRNSRSRLRKSGADYLLYSIIDAVMDDYFDLSEELGNQIETVQDRILNEGTRGPLIDVQRLRRATITFRKSIWPLREAVNMLVKGESALIDDYTAPFFREVYDHTIELMDTVDTHRDQLSEMIDLYQTNVSNQLNQVVKLLTLISVIFAPLTFIVGLYGMNFKYMPELDSPWGYPAILLMMAVVSLIMISLFRGKRWF